MGRRYVFETPDNYTAEQAAAFAAADFPASARSSHRYPGISYDPVAREVFYSVGWVESFSNQPNDTGRLLWSGVHSIADGANYDPSPYRNFRLMKINVDTRLVTEYDPYDPASLVPSGIGGSDGTARRFVEANAGDQQALKLVNPRNGNVLSHHTVTPSSGTNRSCLIYEFRREDGYKQTISPYVPSGNRHLEPWGITANWYLIGDFGKDAANRYTMECIPTERHADEVAADYKLSFSSTVFPVGSNSWDAYGACCSGEANGETVYFFASQVVAGSKTFELHAFSPPAVVANPAAGAAFANLTPWASGAGPELLGAGYGSLSSSLAGPRIAKAMWLHATAELVMINVYFPAEKDTPSTDPLDFHMQVGFYRPGDLAYSFVGDFVCGYMTAGWEMTSDPNAAAWAVTNYWSLDDYREYNSFDYSTEIPDDDAGRRSLFFQVSPVVAGVVGSNDHVLLAQYDFGAFGQVPTLLQLIDEDGWDAAYPAYGTAIGDADVVRASLAVNFSNISTFWDVGLSDPAGNAYWFSGCQGTGVGITAGAAYEFDAAIAPRDAQDLSPPFVRLSFSGRRIVHSMVRIGLPDASRPA